MVSRLGLKAVAVLLLFCMTAAEAGAVTLEFDFTGRASGYFEVDTTNFVIPTSAGQPTTFNVIAANVNITDPGWLFGQLNYTVDNVTQTRCTPAGCSLVFSASVAVPNFGTYHPTLKLDFAQIWLPWTTADQQAIQLAFSSETSPNNWNATGSVQQTVSATPLPPAWTMLLIGLAGFGFVAYRRKSNPVLVAA